MVKNKEALQAHACSRKHRIGIRRKGILWEYNGDGRFLKEKLTTSDKRYWRRWNRRFNRSLTIE